MARHRDVRNLDLDDYYDEDDDYYEEGNYAGDDGYDDGGYAYDRNVSASSYAQSSHSVPKQTDQSSAFFKTKAKKGAKKGAGAGAGAGAGGAASAAAVNNVSSSASSKPAATSRPPPGFAPVPAGQYIGDDLDAATAAAIAASLAEANAIDAFNAEAGLTSVAPARSPAPPLRSQDAARDTERALKQLQLEKRRQAGGATSDALPPVSSASSTSRQASSDSLPSRTPSNLSTPTASRIALTNNLTVPDGGSISQSPSPAPFSPAPSASPAATMPLAEVGDAPPPTVSAKRVREVTAATAAETALNGEAKDRLNMVVIGHVDAGKCWGKNTSLLMLDGHTKLVQDIVEGDVLMGDDNTPRVVQPGSLTRGNTAADAAGSTVWFAIKPSHQGSYKSAPGRQRQPDGKYECKYVGCAYRCNEKANRLVHEKNKKLHTVTTSDAATYRITSTNPGRPAWTCNGAHIIVVKFNYRPTQVRQWPERNSSRKAPFYYSVPAIGADGRVVLKPISFETKEEAQQERDNALVEWEPLVWEGTVEKFLTFERNVIDCAQMYQPDLVNFVSHGMPLRTRLTRMLGREVSEEETELTAWVIGVWLADGRAGTANVSQIKECRQEPSHAHTAVVERLKLWYQIVGESDPGADEPPPARSDDDDDDDDEQEEEEEDDARHYDDTQAQEMHDGGLDTQEIAEELGADAANAWTVRSDDYGQSRSFALKEGKADERQQQEEKSPPARHGIVRFDKWTTAGNAAYWVRLGARFTRLLKEYKIFFKKRVPHHLLAESAEVRLALLTGIVDGDGYSDMASRGIEVPAKKRRFINGVIHLARSLGFSTKKVSKKTCTHSETGEVYRGFRIHITGIDLQKIHTVLQYKRFPPGDASNKDQRCDGFIVEKLRTHKNYYGFTLDGNGRCLMGDFVVSHNSTMMGHLLYLQGRVSQKLIHKYEKESRELGKSSFHFAWVLDETDEERARGITTDVAVSYFSTPTKKITLLDAPGHKEFIPNMITGAAQADAAILVVPATRGEFEGGFGEDGQIREHAMLARSLGVNQLILAVNKLDTVKWDQTRYDEIVAQMIPYLKSVGYKERDIFCVPVSGLTGENIMSRKEPELMQWYSGPVLLDLIDKFSLPVRHTEKPLRLCVQDVFKNLTLGQTVAGKIETGTILVKDKLLLLPIGELVTVKAMESRGENMNVARAGDNIEIGIKDYSDVNVLQVGQWLCDPLYPIPMVTHFRAQIITMNYRIPLLVGSQLTFFTQATTEPIVIHSIQALIDPVSGAIVKKSPRVLPRQSTAIVELTVKNKICLELFRNFRELGRFTLRRGNESVAVGICTKLYRMK